jgi:hypothetical protein
MFSGVSATAFALFTSLSVGSTNAAALVIAYVFTLQSKRVKEFFEIWIKTVLLDLLYLFLGGSVSIMAANIHLIFTEPQETLLLIMTAAGAGLLLSATILSSSFIILLFKYVGRKR